MGQQRKTSAGKTIYLCIEVRKTDLGIQQKMEASIGEQIILVLYEWEAFV